ncbi:hypothetical protein [Cloacibacillus porcorum]|jgi:hypothetical protein|uniref:Uncharacterized protein n=1 Tax=Cloacibacillus porcorum TaxID=1197717 RepID=A0A1B2I932_9BACT|nr:hypothetical protein [Cloacibacillus porcorum]ANZ46461.1 hypothetical protein BED41_15940 [Cloacibacillus porcorum]MCC8184590.1 hypothetical protein [Cloacibacillus porcorum]MCI5865107.1 hypothetical protein [Cloacibacillus porcorum]MDD7648385.1 hypothetical protein [Cloacibacillus porcorum]MDY4094434.1 hypothetical protein [Cloacibacillus porcorum]
MTDFSFLASASEIWEEWRFEPWKSGTAEGLYRRVSMVKSGLLGEVARYYADDYIIWKHEANDVERLRREAKSESDLLLQRFVFLRENEAYHMKKSSLMFGFRGFVELHFFTPGDDIPKAIQDTAFLVNAALRKLGK